MLLAIFIAYPFLALLIGAVLFAIGILRRTRFLAGTGVIWVAYAVYEYAMKARILCTGECNIRVDLLLVYPALLAATVLGIARAMRRRGILTARDTHR